MSVFERLQTAGALSVDHFLLTDCLTEAETDTVVSARMAFPQRVLTAVDHDTPAGTAVVSARQKKLRDFARAGGGAFCYGGGIGYYLLMEAGLAPGEIVACCGARAATVGAVGAVGLTLTAAEMKTALETGTVSLDGAPVVHLRLEGALDRYVSARDLALTLIAQNRYAGALLAIHGPQLAFDQRVALCNLLGEAHVKSAWFTEEAAAADVCCDLGAITPQAALPGGFDRIVPAGDIDGLRVNQVFLGGCAAGSLESLRRLAALWQGKTVSPYVRVMVAPATANIYARALDEGLLETFMAAGALVMNQGCSACWAQSQGRCDGGEVFATTGSINCAGWAGAGHNGIVVTSLERAAQAALSGCLYES